MAKTISEFVNLEINLIGHKPLTVIEEFCELNTLKEKVIWEGTTEELPEHFYDIKVSQVVSNPTKLEIRYCNHGNKLFAQLPNQDSASNS